MPAPKTFSLQGLSPRHVLVVLALFLSGCLWINGTGDLEQFVDQTLAKKPGPIEPLPEFKPYQSFVYRGASLRDPFQPLQPVSEQEEFSGDESVHPDLQRPKDYLENFAVDQLKMVGTISQLGEGMLFALVKDPNGEVHRVKVGEHLGLDYGEVLEVSPHGVRLREIVANGRGGWMTRPRELTLSEQQ